MDEPLESFSPHSGAATDAVIGMPATSAAATAGRMPGSVAALTTAMARGDDAAFREFYDVYFDRLLRYLLVVTRGNEETAREALQLTLVRVVRHVKPMDAEDKFWSWLTVLARSALADETRKHRRYFAFLDRFTRQRVAEPAAPSQGEAEDQLHALLARQMSALPADERQLLEQKYLLRQSVRAIAAGQQTTEKAIESKLSRVRRKLKDAVLGELKPTKNEPAQ